MLTRLFADRLAGEGIRVYEVRPGVIQTDMTAAVQEIFQWLHNNGCGQDDHSSIIKYYKKLTGIESL